jgi:hypothetical protein
MADPEHMRQEERELQVLLEKPKRQFIDRCRERLSSTIPTTLYHYTDRKGFTGIVSTGELWASNIRCLNDTTEISHSDNLLLQRAERLIQRTHDPEERNVLELLKSGRDFVRQKFGVYSISLSSKHDDLSQWRGYASSVGGFAIGFEFKKLRRSIFEAGKTGEPILVKVVYNRKKQKERLDYILEKTVRFFRKLRQSGRISTVEDFKIVCRDVINLFAEELLRFKNPVFSEEKEWRLVVLGDDNMKIYFRSGDIPYIKCKPSMLSEPGNTKLPITKIIQGPIFQPKISKRAVKRYMIMHGYYAKVVTSNVPLR